MDKKGINEVRKLFSKDDCRIDRMCGCYVNEKKEHIADIAGLLSVLPDEEQFKYCDIFRKALSGKVGKTLHNVEIPLSEEKEGGRQPELYRLLKSGLKDPELVERFFDRVINCYKAGSDKYLILLVHGVYDIPGRGADGIFMEDASLDVYEFLQLSICPVTLLRDGLCYDADEKSFVNRTEDWGVQKPDTGFLYPAFNDRNADIHAALWYARNEENRHEELSEELLGCPLPRARSEEQNVFREVIEIALGEDCDYENVKNVNEAVNRLVEEGKDEPEPVEITKGSLRAILYDNGADDEAVARLDKAYDELAGEDEAPILAENIAEPKKIRIRSDSISLDVDAESAELVETRVIDGMEYFLIPVTDNVTVNGIRIRRKGE